MSFNCDYCGYQNNEIQSGGKVQDLGIPKNSDEFQRIPKDSKGFQRIPKIPKILQNIPKDLKRLQKIPKISKIPKNS